MTGGVLFLDIDGVLNSRAYPAITRGMYGISPHHVKHLNRICEKSRCKIVISSSWRLLHKRHKISVMLADAGFCYVSRITGVTPDLCGKPRGLEIQRWLDGKGINRFVILDDNEDMAHLHEHLVQTHPAYGLTEELADRVIGRLKA